MDIRVRDARREDLRLAHRWANDPVNIRMNVKSGVVPLDTFARLFSELLYDKEVLLLIAEGLHNGDWIPIAQVRIDTDGEMSLFIDNDFRGRKLATPIILASIEFAGGIVPLNRVVAKIRLENIPSIRAFKTAGFNMAGELVYKGHACVEYEYRIQDFTS